MNILHSVQHYYIENGEYSPKEGRWQIASILASGNGMLLITMSVTYILSVINSVIQQRSFADSVTAMGESSEEIIKNSWNGKDFEMQIYF